MHDSNDLEPHARCEPRGPCRVNCERSIRPFRTRHCLRAPRRNESTFRSFGAYACQHCRLLSCAIGVGPGVTRRIVAEDRMPLVDQVADGAWRAFKKTAEKHVADSELPRLLADSLPVPALLRPALATFV